MPAREFNPQFRPLFVEGDSPLVDRDSVCLLMTALLLMAGCGGPRNAVPAPSAPSTPAQDPVPDPSPPATSAPTEADGIAAFLAENSFCSEVLNGRPLADFLTKFPMATMDREQSRHDFQYVVYREGMFMYEFLDEKLFGIRFVIPRSAKSAEDWIAPYLTALGPPTNTKMPEDFREAKASRFRSWDLPRHNLRINLVDLPASFGEADLDLFGQFINWERAQEYLRRSAASGPAAKALPSLLGLPSRRLQQAWEVASQENAQDPLVVELWAGIGLWCAQSGEADVTGQLLTELERQPETALKRSCRARIAGELVAVLAAAGRTEDAILFLERIPPAASPQCCAALSAIAIAREAREGQTERDPLWKRAIDAIDQGTAQQRAENSLAIIQNLAKADRLAEAEVLATAIEKTLSNRSGWRPIAERLAIRDEMDAAKTMLREKLAGRDQDLYHFIGNVLAERRFQSRFEICRAALGRITNPVLLAQGSCVLFGEMTDSHQLPEARRELGLALQRAEKARVNHRDTGAVLLSAIDAMVALEGQPAGANICQTLKARFAPEIAAEGYRKLATHFAAEPTEVKRYLEMAEELARHVVVVETRLPLLRQIYRTRSAFLDEEASVRAVETLKGPLDRGYAWLGTAEGLPHTNKP